MNAQYLSRMLFLDLGWLLLLSFLLGYFWYVRRQAVRAREWNKAKARIVRCELIREGPRLWPKIEYIYNVDQQDYVGEHLFFDTSHQNPNSLQARQLAYYVANAYKNDEDIEIYYNPNHPEQAVISIRVPWKLNLIISLITTLIALHITIIVIQILS